MDKRTKAKKQDDFLKAFGELVSIQRAAKKVKISRDLVYDWRQKDPAFKKKFEETRKIAAEALEDEAIRRAFEGVVKPVFQGGKKVGSIREYSDALMARLLAAHNPEKFKERVQQEQTGKDGGPIKHEIKRTVVFKKYGE